MQRIAVVLVLPLVLLSTTTVRAQDTAPQRKELEDILLLQAKKNLSLPFRDAPMPCFAPWITADDDNLVRNVSPSGLNAGLRPGDVLRKVGAQVLDGSTQYEWQMAMTRMAYGLTSFFIEVTRSGKPVTLTLPCQAPIAQRLFEAERRMLTAVVQRNWNACLTSGAIVIDAYATPVSEVYSRMKSCGTMADVDDKEAAEYIFDHALALTLESQALNPKPQDLIEGVRDALRQLDVVRVAGGEDYASKLRAAMSDVGMSVPAASSSPRR